MVFFRTFPTCKKSAPLGSALGVGTECGLYFIHACVSTGSCGLGAFLWRDEAGFEWVSDGFQPVEQGGTVQRCTATLQGDEVAGMAFSFLGSFFCPSLCNDRCQGRVQAERASLFMRQSTVAFERISCISCSRCSHLETWRISSWPCVFGVACGILKT